MMFEFVHVYVLIIALALLVGALTYEVFKLREEMEGKKNGCYKI